MKKVSRLAIAVALMLSGCAGKATATVPPDRAAQFFNYLQKTASEALQLREETARNWQKKLDGLTRDGSMKDALERISAFFAERAKESDNNGKSRSGRQLLENIGRYKVGNDGQTVNEYAREVIQRLHPDFCDSGFYHDPAGALSYFIMLDPRGFAENVRIIRGPLDSPMTIKEAYQYYTRTDEKKATMILNMLESLQKLGQPDADSEQLQQILDAAGQTIELLNHEP